MRSPIRHGTETAYSRGCRCEDCRTAYSVRARERRQGIRRKNLPRRYDARALLRYFDPEETDVAIGARLRVNRREIMEWKRGNDILLNTYRADTLANRLGAHPCEVWGADWWRYADDDTEGLDAID